MEALATPHQQEESKQQQHDGPGSSAGGAAPQRQERGAPDAAAGAAAGAGAAAAPGCSVRCFSEVTPSDGRLDFQIIDLGRQLYVWVAAGGAKFGNLSFSIQTPGQAAPSTAVLVRGGAGSSADALSQRLAMRLKRPVLCSCNLPADNPLLQVVAERRLLKELLGGGGGDGVAPVEAAAAAAGAGGS
ncbi:MAG: hypothetical protein J3K34DRAFT_130669 [Monoraphidium minutum]|nr:MAG: hypothetical protein J3K34DRAFT_130669 [Monoraphidium minutum]